MSDKTELKPCLVCHGTGNRPRRYISYGLGAKGRWTDESEEKCISCHGTGTIFSSVQEAAPPALSAAQPTGWYTSGGDETVTLHGPEGCIVGGLSAEQAEAIIEAHGRAAAPSPKD